MKVLHTSDWHLGRKFLAQDMHEHQESFVDWLIEITSTHDVELVVIAGDIFDRSIPPQESVVLFEKAITELSAASLVYVVPGNHDSAVRLGYGGKFFAANGVHIQSSLDGIATPLEVTSGDGTELVVYGIPYLHPDIHSAELGVERSHDAVLNAVMDRVRADLNGRESVRSIAVSHAFVTGGASSESERDVEIGGVGDVPSRVYSGVDYVAMGHLHGAQVISSESGIIRYSGSPLPYSFSEEKHTKSVTLVDIPSQGEITFEVIPVPQPAPLITLRGTMEHLETSGDLDDHVDSWIRFQITDPRRPDNAMQRLSQRFNHVMHLEFDPEISETDQMTHVVRLDPHKTPPIELATSFIRYVTGDQAKDSEVEVLRESIENINSQANTP